MKRYKLSYSYSDGTDDFDYWDSIINNKFYENDIKKFAQQIEQLINSGISFENFSITDRETGRQWSNYKDFKLDNM